MENTIIINRAIMNRMDFEAGKISISKNLTEINDTNSDYIHKKLDKTLNSLKANDVVVGTMHELYLRKQNSEKSDEEFLKQCKEITDHLFEMGTQIEDMPNSTVLFADVYFNGERTFVIIKINHKLVPVTIYQDGEVIISERQQMPGAGSSIEEAIIVGDERIRIIEKKFMIDGKKDTYLNTHWIKGELQLNGEQILRTMKKVINKLDVLYKNDSKEALAAMKQALADKMVSGEPVKPVEIVKEALGDYGASEEAETIMNDVGISSDDTLDIVDDKISRCKLVSSDGIEITMDASEYLSNRIRREVDANGRIRIIIDDLESVEIR